MCNSCGDAELGINLSHILDKSLIVLNPLHKYSAAHAHDAHMMDDTDLAGPLLFCFVLGMELLLVSMRCGAGWAEEPRWPRGRRSRQAADSCSCCGE